jgi:transcriptional regulator with XRE-family HTH domain
MKLQKYLEERDIAPSSFARRIEISAVTLWRYCNGLSRPEWPIMDRIAEETDQAVMPNDYGIRPVRKQNSKLPRRQGKHRTAKNGA